MRRAMGWIAIVAVSVPWAWHSAHLLAPSGSPDLVLLTVLGTPINMLTLWTLHGLLTGRLR